MKTSLKAMVLVVLFTLSLLNTSILASDLVHEFKNPAFSGNGYSNHVLSIDQLQSQRKKANEDEAKSAAAAVEREAKNTTINKFIANVESRIYANLSKQLVDNMFGTGCDSTTTTCPTSGTSTVEGATIYWVKDTTTEIITLTITDENGTVTTMSVPIGDFVF
ncbi:curli assembly protein CsgF [bacterium]|nr:curli assembly protein CsgF [bacterium]